MLNQMLAIALRLLALAMVGAGYFCPTESDPMAEDLIPSVETYVNVIFSKLDRIFLWLTEKRYWALWIGAASIAFSMLAHTPLSSMTDFSGWEYTIIKKQIANPLTPIDFQQFRAVADAVSPLGAVSLSHWDKIAFRLSIPIIGKVLNTGAASFIVVNYIAGFLFFPLFAHVANTLLQDRLSAAYVTVAFSLSFAGTHFFNDNTLGDGFAWLCLLAAIYFRHPLLIFAAVLIAAFTDERALLGSAAAFLYWLGNATTRARKDSRHNEWARAIAIVVAWLAYLGLRWYLSYSFGLKTGTTELFRSVIIRDNSENSIPYQLLDVFQGLWVWIPIAVIALYISERFFVLFGFLTTLACTLAVALVVWDFQRSVGYSLLLLPVAWQAHGLKSVNVRKLARGCFILGLCLVVPYHTFVRHLFTGAFGA